MNERSMIVSAWAGITCTVFLGLALWPAAGFFPPLSPADSAADIAEIFRGKPTGIRASAMLLLVSAACFAAFTAGIAAAIQKIEGSDLPVLSNMQLLSGGITTLLFVSMAVTWAAASFRLERGDEIIWLLNDLAWIWFLFTVTLPALQVFSLGFAILGDRSQDLVFPRWAGYLNLWIGVLFLPGILVPMFKTGPFAWDGLLAFWLPGAAFFGWFYMVAFQIIGAARRGALK